MISKTKLQEEPDMSEQKQLSGVGRIQELLARLQPERPRPDRNLDQFFATTETVIRRIRWIVDPGRLPKSIIFLGDDDLTSIALAILAPKVEITVVDIDHRILDFIRGVATREQLRIHCVEHDLRMPLGKDVGTDYAAAFFDPPYTPNAVRVWLQRALEATLGKGSNWKRKQPSNLGTRNYYLCYGYTDVSTERGLAIQGILTEEGFVIQEKMRRFNAYVGAEAIGSQSDLYHLQATPSVKLRKVDVARNSFYTGQRRK